MPFWKRWITVASSVSLERLYGATVCCRYKYETLDDSIDRKIGEKERQLQSDHRYTGGSLNEIHI